MTIQRILVTGGAGFIGSWIARTLFNDGHDVRVIDIATEKNLRDLTVTPLPVFPYGRFYQGHLASTPDLVSLFDEWKPEIVVYCAANAREGASQFQPSDVTRNGLMAFNNLMSQVLRHGVLKPKKVIFFSSMSVYGKGEPPFTEGDPPAPVDIYGWNKLAQEECLGILAGVHGFDYKIIRPHNVFGPLQALNDQYRNVIGIWMNKIMRCEPLTIYGNGMQTRQFSYIEDSLPAYLKVILGDALGDAESDTYNIGGNTDWVILDLAVEVVEAMRETRPPDREMLAEGKPYPMEYLPDRPLEVKNAVCDNRLAVRELGLAEHGEGIGVQAGLRRMAKWAWSRGPMAWAGGALEIPSDKAPAWWTVERILQ